MKKIIILLCFICSIIHISCKAQTNSQITSDDNVVVSTGIDIIYPLASDKYIEENKKAGKYCSFIYPLLILNGVIIREETKINCFRNRFEFVNIKNTKRISKEQAEKMDIPNVPKDGVLFVTIKKGYYFDFSCK